MRLGTKAETLDRLSGKLSRAEILPLVYFTVKEYKNDQLKIWKDIHDKWISKDQKIIVRSSALNEDTSESSQAGKFESVIDIDNEKDFYNAVKIVTNSFDDNNPGNQILVQPMLEQVKKCGVAFTIDPNTLGNYYVINYDETGSTNSITAGTGENSKLLYIFKRIKENTVFVNPRQGQDICQLCAVLKELEDIFDQYNLDVEFAISENGKIYILQVRTLVIKDEIVNYTLQYEELKRIENKIRSEQNVKPFLYGDKTIYGVMPDWNPAEMIGIRPKPLAASLYRDVITDSVWAYQRHNYGYRNLRSFPLMPDFGGLPYIDVRVSFNSFIPAELDERIGEKLVNYYIDRLSAEPSKHDKVEFDIVFSCYTLDLPQRIEILRDWGFTSDDISQILIALRNLTNNIINNKTGLWRQDYAKIEILKERYEKIIHSNMNDIEKIYWLIEDCKRYGTLPFAGLARAAFIAVQLLQSLVTKEIISKEEYQYFMNDVNTVGSQMSHDFAVLTKYEFLEKYGHLRPGTYDITSERYDEAPELYFDWGGSKEESQTQSKKFSLTIDQLHRLSDALEENGLGGNVLELLDFIKGVVEGREYGKFVFTRNISKILEMIGNLGKTYSLTKEDCAFLDIKCIQELYKSTRCVEDALKEVIDAGRHNYEITSSLILPPLIIEPEDIWDFHYPDSEPNYITLSNVTGEVVLLESGKTEKDICGKILLIPSADPGYDWIFSRGIVGFITKYGGANSHMAIRAGELGIPAIVGVGTKQFEQYKKAKYIKIDGLAQIVTIMR